MPLSQFLEHIKHDGVVSFDETIAVITAHYDYQPTAFSNGLHERKLISMAGTNEGSCRIFAFAQLHQLSPQQTLNLFGDFYRHDVLDHPQGTDHQNIRTFMADGWAGIVFDGVVLTPRPAPI
ncbi:MAG: HopJ type III effector protein [Methylovulum sp.]|nr:HopJ type III effector protein [Methylovulum sp.]